MDMELLFIDKLEELLITICSFSKKVVCPMGSSSELTLLG